MDSEDYKKVKEIFGAALEIEPGRRSEYVNESCGENDKIRSEVERLLTSYDEEFMDTPAVADFAEDLGVLGGRSGQTMAHYHLLEMLGSGGMGEVYLAEDEKLGRKVAIKILPEEFTADPDRLNRFQLEARSASALSHPNIITIYEIGESDGAHYIATEFVDGETLRQRLSEERFSVQESLECGVQLAAGITAAHEAGITHRDIKPENVMIRSDGLLKVLDFGLAKHAKPAAVAVAPAGYSEEPTIRMVKTEPGVVMGTVQYMSPEQARGNETDARTDIWSLGCVLYEMLCGRPPFCGDTSADLIAEIVKSPASPVRKFCPGVPERLEEIVSKALEKNQPDRYQTSRDLLNDLKRLQKNIDANPELSRARLLRRFRPRKFKRAKVKRTTEKDLANVSSAEYLIWGIKAHRFTTAGIVLLIMALLGTTAFLTRRYWASPNEARMNYASKINLAAQALEGMDLQQAENLLKETTPNVGETDLRGFEWGYLARVLAERNSSKPISLHHEGRVESVAFSPDGTKLATGGKDNLIHIWDIATGEKLSTFTGHEDWVSTVSFSPDGSKLLSGSVDNTVRLWEVGTGIQLLSLTAMGGQFSKPAFFRNGASIIAFGGNAIRSWDAETGAETKLLAANLEEYSHFALSPDERTLAIRVADQSVSVRSTSTGKTLATLKGHSGLVTDLHFSPDSKSLVTGSTDGTVKTWDIRTGKNVRTFVHSGEVYDVAFSPDGETVASGSTDDTIKVWDVQKAHPRATFKGHRDRIQALAFSLDGRRLASGGGDKTAKIWNVPAGEPRGILRGHSTAFTSVAFSPDGKTLLATGNENATRSWSVEEERERTVLPDSGELAFAPNGRDVAVGGKKAIRIWDLLTGKVRQTIEVTKPPTNLTYSTDGRLLVFGSLGDRKIRVWAAETGRDICSFEAHPSGASFISFTKEERIITSSMEDNMVRVWDPQTCITVNSFAGGTDARFFTSVVKGGQIWALDVLNNARSLRLVSMMDNKEIASFKGHEGELSDAEFSPDASRLATSSEDGSIKIWDTLTGQELLTIRPEAGAIGSIAFSPNNEVLAAAGGDGTVRLFRSTPAVSEGPLQIYQLVPKQLQ